MTDQPPPDRADTAAADLADVKDLDETDDTDDLDGVAEPSGAAERAGIVDPQDAVLSEMERADDAGPE